MTLRVVELYCGIGGCSAALARILAGTPAAGAPAAGAPAASPIAEVVLAVDIHQGALAVYRHNFPQHPCRAAAVESVPAGELADLGADLWWLSPPCQPFTRRGRRRDADDPRAATFLTMIERLATVRPPWVALENVPGFVGSRVHRRLLETLAEAGYSTPVERLLCPSQLGWPNRRRRYYLVATRRELLAADRLLPEEPPAPAPLSDFLDPDDAPDIDPTLWVEPALLQRYEGALDMVRRNDPEALTACFTSAYGRSPVRSGSYLLEGGGAKPRARRFSPAEILRLLDFPPDFRLPAGLEPRKAWPLVGNSLSLLPVRAMLDLVPPLAGSLRGNRHRKAGSPSDAESET